MHKIKKRAPAAAKRPALYNIIEDYSECDPPGNVWACAMTDVEDLDAHALVLGESYAIPHWDMQPLLRQGGGYVHPQTGLLVTRGAFACRLDPAGVIPKLTWGLDVEQYAEAEQMTRAYGVTLEEAAWRVFQRTLAPELQDKLQQKNLGLDTPSWTVPSPREETSNTLISGRTGPRTSSACASCRTERWWKPAASTRLPGSMRLRLRRLVN